MPRPTDLVRFAALASFLSVSCFGATASLKAVGDANGAAVDLSPVGVPATLSVSLPAQDPKKQDDEEEADDEARDEEGADASETMGSEEEEEAAPAESAPAPKGVEALAKQVAQLEKRLALLEKLLEKLAAQVGSARADAALTPAAGGYESAVLSISHNHKTANVKVTVNGVLVARYGSGAHLDLAPFMQAGKVNRVGVAITAPDPKSSAGIAAHIEAKLRGSEQAISVFQFQSAPDHLADEFELPFAGAKG